MLRFAAASSPTTSSVAGSTAAPQQAGSGARLKLRPAALAPLFPAAVLAALWLVWIPANGGYFPDSWYPSAALACTVLGLTIAVTGRTLPGARTARIALLSFAATVAFSYLSMLWAAAPGDALAATNKLLLYLAVAWTFAILPWTPRRVTVLLGGWSVGVAAFCAAGLVQATGAAKLDPFFDQLRYATPLHYPNGTAALAVMGMWPAVILATRRELAVWIRAPMLAIGVFLAEFAFLPQSRGALVGLVLTVPLVLVLCTGRLRLLVHMAVVGGGLAITIPLTVNLDDAINAGRRAAPVLHHAAATMVVTSLAASAIGVVLAMLDRRWSPRRFAGRRWRFGPRARLALLVAASLIVVGGGIVAAPKVSHFTKSVWRSGRNDAPTGSTRLLSATPEERFDYARVAWRLFTSAPLGGVGAGNFGRGYDAKRRFEKHSLYTHDLGLRALSETGIVGLALLVTVILALSAGVIGALRRLDGLGRACAAAALALAAYFLVHASLDWLEEFPVLAAPALALPLAVIAMGHSAQLPGVAPRSAPRPRATASPIRAGHRRVATRLAVAALSVLVTLALGPAYLATRYVERASATFKASPSVAFSDLSRARSLNPLSATPMITEGMIAISLGETGRAQNEFEAANRREDTWFAHLELALLKNQAGLFGAAQTELSRAAALDADDPVIKQARSIIVSHRQIDPTGFSQALLGGSEASVFRTNHIS